MAKDRQKLYYMEETLNLLAKRNAEKIFKKNQESDDKYQKISQMVADFEPEKSFFQVLEEWLFEKRFVKKSGKLDYAGFYEYARISKTTWSHLRIWSEDHTGNQPSKETLLKIVIGLKLTPEEANELMTKASNSLNYYDFRDRVIMACMHKNIYAPEDIYEILEYFSKTENGTGRRFQNIYRCDS